LNAERIWQISGSWTNNGLRMIPSVVVVQHSDTHPSAVVGDWNHDVTVNGFTYRIGHVNHIDYDVSTNPAGFPNFWGGTLAHEYSHNFLNGYDLYGGGGGKIGYWDILGDSLLAGKMSDSFSYFKTRLGWINYKNVLNGPTMAATEFHL